MPAYRRLATSGQIEISTTPYYHPILPLLCDSNIARVAHPNMSLPPRFRYPGDARRQLELAREYVERHFGVRRSVCGRRRARSPTKSSPWPASWASSGPPPIAGCSTAPATRRSGGGLYRPYEWRQGGHNMRLIFRDHFMSDLIGFVYSKMEASHAAADFLHRIRQNCAAILAAGRDALVPIILDGENAGSITTTTAAPSCASSTGALATTLSSAP